MLAHTVAFLVRKSQKSVEKSMSVIGKSPLPPGVVAQHHKMCHTAQMVAIN